MSAWGLELCFGWQRGGGNHGRGEDYQWDDRGPSRAGAISLSFSPTRNNRAYLRGSHDAGELIGTLIVSHPTLNGPWRERAWPGQYPSRGSCQRLNREIRTISRVVVDPRWRGMGIGCALVRAYLDHPATERTEAISAMGNASTLFIVAGMKRVAYPPSRRVISLRGRLHELGIDVWRLVDPDGLIRALTPHRASRLHHALRAFASAHRDTRAITDSDLRTLIIAAARRVASHPAAFVAEKLAQGENP